MRVKAGFYQPVAQPGKAGLREKNLLALTRVRMHCIEYDMIGAAGKIHHLPGIGKLIR